MDFYTLNAKETLSLPQNADHPVILTLLRNYTLGVEWQVSHGAADCCICLGNAVPVARGDAAFVLNVTPDGAYIEGRDYNSTVNGFVTLLEKIFCYDKGVYRAACGIFRESPALGFRAAHFCVFPETSWDFLRKCVLTCAVMRYSHVILEFWGTLRLDSMKELAWAEAYDKTQVRALCREANALGLEIIPFFQHLGHASLSRMGASGKHVVLDQAPEYEYLYYPGSYGWVWDYQKPEVRALLQRIRDELCELCGEGSYFHLGCDEATVLSVGENRAAEVSEYLNEVQRDLKSKGRRAIMWGDMLLCEEDFKEAPKRPWGRSVYECNSTREIADTFVAHLDKSIVIADWEYEVAGETWRSAKHFRDAGFDVICCSYSKPANIDAAVRTACEEKLMGYMKTTWHTLARQVPKLAYGGVASWQGHGLSAKQQDILGDNTAHILRRISPPKGNYATAGWSEEQIRSDLS